jgi:hypothetical protein
MMQFGYDLPSWSTTIYEGETTVAISLKGTHFPPAIILMDVRWYLAYPLVGKGIQLHAGLPYQTQTVIWV